MKAITALLVTFFLAACQDDVQTIGELNAAKVSEQIALYKVERMVVYEYRSNGEALVYDGGDYKIEGQFLRLGLFPFSYWNFESLKSFTLTDSKTIVLRF